MSTNWITFLALKNLFTRGTLIVRFFKAFIIFGAPLLVAYILADSYGTWDEIKESRFWIVVSQLALFVIFWLREMLELTIRNNANKTNSQLIERNYIYCSVFLLFSYVIYDSPYSGHAGPDLFFGFLLLINCGLIISGIALTIGARKRKPIFWMLMGVTLATGSYPFLVYG